MRIGLRHSLIFRGQLLLPLLLLLLAFFIIELAYPRFPAPDEIFYKSAGRNISHGGAFAAPELEGFLHADPPIERVYSMYPPLYTWLFGQWLRATGFDWRACVGYDAFISVTLASIVYGLTYIVAGALFGSLSVIARMALAFLAALLTLLFRNPGRPDELGMVLGFANALWLYLHHSSCSRQTLVAFVSGVLAALMLFASPGAFLAFLPFLTALWLWGIHDVQKIAVSLATAALGGVIVAALCQAPLFLAHPHFYKQFFQHLQFAVGRAWHGSVFGAVSYAWHYYRHSVFIMVGTLPILCVGIVILWRTGRFWEMIALFVAPMVGFVVVFLFEEINYWWFLQPWFLLLAIVVAADYWCGRRSRLVAIVASGWLAIWLAAATAWPVKDYLIRLTLPPDQRLTLNAQKLRELIPMGAQVLTLSGWWALGSDRSVYDPIQSDIPDLARIEYFVADSNGTGQPGVWARPKHRYDKTIRENFEVISDTLPRTPLRVFGIRITNSAYGFGTIVMRRVPPKSP